ncbi:abortive infection protein [Micromonospora sp. NPDC049900]|uniref:abortive infection protein n=1 Tax=unclassified Micromonospora TaxID=2617518 RepID=UPI00378F5CF8
MVRSPQPDSSSGSAGVLRSVGVAYDTGTNFATGQGELSRVLWSTDRMVDEIGAIRRRLHCNSVTVYGSDLGRLDDTARAAAEVGLHVWWQPRLVDRPQSEVVDHLAEAARLAERLRRDGAAVSFSAGCVHSVFTPGLLPGGRYHERMANVFADADHHLLRPTDPVDLVDGNQRLNQFLDGMLGVVRSHFSGEVGYAAAPFEDVDWRLCDVIRLMHFYTLGYPARDEDRVAEITRYHRWGKPVMIAEFGTATHTRAAEQAFLSFDVVDRSGAVPTVRPGVRRDEPAQAEFHQRMLDVFVRAGVHGVAVSEFIHPTHPFSVDPRVDLDVASMALVRTIREYHDDPASPYRWEPKQSFHALAARYAALGGAAPRTDRTC